MISNPGYPTLLDRFKALIADGFIVVLLLVFTGLVIAEFPDTPGWVRGALFVLLFLLYEPIMVTTGGTIGHRIMGLRVVSNKYHDRHIILPLAIARTIVKALLGWLSFVTLSSNEKSRAIHDMAGMSVVLYRDSLPSSAT